MNHKDIKLKKYRHNFIFRYKENPKIVLTPDELKILGDKIDELINSQRIADIRFLQSYYKDQ